jgi:hypothetical protein
MVPRYGKVVTSAIQYCQGGSGFRLCVTGPDSPVLRQSIVLAKDS